MSKTIKNIMTIIVGILMLQSTAYADNAQMNATLVQLINQINAMMPLIDAAEKQQDKTAPMQFHYDTFIDANGIQHNGLRQDLLTIRQSLINEINQPPLAPRTIIPLQLDYVEP